MERSGKGLEKVWNFIHQKSVGTLEDISLYQFSLPVAHAACYNPAFVWPWLVRNVKTNQAQANLITHLSWPVCLANNGQLKEAQARDYNNTMGTFVKGCTNNSSKVIV